MSRKAELAITHALAQVGHGSMTVEGLAIYTGYSLGYTRTIVNDLADRGKVAKRIAMSGYKFQGYCYFLWENG